MTRNKLQRKRIICSLLTLMIALGSFVDASKAFAIPDFDLYEGNEITHIDPDASLDGTCGAGAGGVQLSGKDNIEKALSFYMGKGLNLMQAAGIVGNYMAESGVDPRKEEGKDGRPPRIVDDSYTPINGTGFGLAQWTFTSRQAPLVKFMKDNGNLGITDLGGQLGYSWQELQGSHKHAYESLKKATSPLNAAYVFHRDFEGSADSEEKIRANRGGNAEKLYAQYKDAPPLAGSPSAGGGGASSSSSACSAPTGDLAKTVLAYAWPEYHAPNYTNKKPEYQTALDKAIGQGRYVGGGAFPGVDCGGFVTTLMVDSGFEPRYNSNGKGGPTGDQEAWARQNWTTIGKGNQVHVGGDAADPKVLRPGDVAFQPGHTFVYVGKIPGFGEGDPAFKGVASASYQIWRAPMVGHESLTDSDLTWYRKK